jgi:PAS domain S-box-containing protein
MSEPKAPVRQDQREEKAFLALADALSPLIALIQAEKVVHVNPSGCRLLGHPLEYFVGRNFWEFALAQDQEAIRDRERARQAGIEQPRRFRERVHHADGHDVWIDYSLDPIRLDGVPTTLVTGHDVTEQKKAEEALRKSEQLFRGLYKQTPTMMWSVGWDGCFREVSDALLERLGYERHELIGVHSHLTLTEESLQRLLEMNARALEAREWWTRDFPLQVRRKDGEILDIRFSGVPELDENGVPQGWICVATDFTEINRAQEDLRRSEERFRSAFQNAAIGKAIVSPELRFQQVNRAYCEMFGYPESELLTMSPDDLTHAEDRGESAALLRRLMAGECSSGTALKRYRHKDGHSVWGEQTITLIRDGEKKPLFLIGEIVDATERLHAEELLRDREAKLAEAQRVAHMGSWEYDIQSGRSIWSDEMYGIFGLDPESFDPTYHSAIPRIHPDDVAHSGAYVQETIKNGTPYQYEFRIVLDDGEVRNLWTIGRAELGPDGRPSRVYGIVQDVTERKRAEEGLRASETRFRSLYTQAPILMTVVGADGRFREVSDFWLARFGYRREEVIGHEAPEFATPESFARLIAAYDKTVAKGELVIRNTPMEGIRRDGTKVHALVTSLLEFGDNKEFKGVITVGMDISDMRRAEEAVRESEARYRALVEHAPEAIVVADGDNGKFVDVNEQAVRLFRRSRVELLSLGPAECSPAFQPNGRASSEMAQDVIRRSAVETQTFEWIHLDGEGRDIPCLIRLSKMPDRTRNLIRATITDISQQKAMEEKLRQDDRMAAIGVLAAGVAHEIGNPLLALSMAAESLQRKTKDDYAAKKLALIREHIERISRIVRQMSDLARAPAQARSAVDLNRVLERSLEVVRYDKRAKSVAIEVAPCGDLPFVQAAEDQLVQVCLNLALNAVDAVAANPPERPRSLEIGVRCLERDGRRFVRAGFRDSGPGVPEASRAKIFQPFFTTKEPGKGTGLGLYVSYRIIEEHQGKLGFDTDPARGTEFYFELPARENP